MFSTSHQQNYEGGQLEQRCVIRGQTSGQIENGVHSNGIHGGRDGQWESKAEKGKSVCPHEEIGMPPDIIFEWSILPAVFRYCSCWSICGHMAGTDNAEVGKTRISGVGQE